MSFEEFFPEDDHVIRGLDADMHLITLDGNYRDGDVLPDAGGLSWSPGQYQHVDIPPRSVSIGLRAGA